MLTMDIASVMPARTRSRALVLWRHVLASLEAEIVGGELVPGQQLPTEQALADRFQVHRNTVRRALDALRDGGLIRVEQGRGSFVRERVVRHPLDAHSRLTSTVKDLERVGSRHYVGSRNARASQAMAVELGLAKGDVMRRVDILSTVDGHPVAFAKNFFPLPRFRGIERIVRQTQSISTALTAYGVAEYHRHETRVTATMPSRADADTLRQSRLRPVLAVTTVNRDAAGVPIQLVNSKLSPQWIELVVRPADD